MSRPSVPGNAGFERRFLAKIGETWRASAPSVRIQAHHRGLKILDLALGDEYENYDFASVTKIMFTATALMFHHDDGAYSTDDPISAWVPWFPASRPERLSDLMCHSAGMTWWYPFYKSVVKKTSPRTSPEEAWRIFQGILKRQIMNDLTRRPKLSLKKPFKRPKSVYSDVDLFLLGLALENIGGASLFDAWETVRERVGLRNTVFHRDNRPRTAKSKYAPTEDDKTFRHKLLQGEVHDQNTWSLKGVAPHAGLFGPIDDMSKWGLALRGAMRGKKLRNFVTPETVKHFTRRQIPRSSGDWALLFMMPSEGSASCGRLFSANSVGHTGYTGTSLWYDPRRDLLVTILTNRIHPSVDNVEIRKLRPKIHTWIAEEL